MNAEAELGPPGGLVAEATSERALVLTPHLDASRGDLLLALSRNEPERVDLLEVSDARQRSHRPDDRLDLAKARIACPDAWAPEGDALLELICEPLLSATLAEGKWRATTPRHVLEPFAPTHRVVPGTPSERLLAAILEEETAGDLTLGHLRAGARVLSGVPIRVPVAAFASHVALLGRTGMGKSHAVRVLMREARALEGRPLALVVLDPHDEYAKRKAEPRRPLRLSRGDVTPADLAAVLDFPEMALAFAEEAFHEHGELWIDHLRRSSPANAQESTGELFAPRRRRRREAAVSFHEETVAAVLRRLAFLGDERTSLFTSMGRGETPSYESDLVSLLAAAESGRTFALDTSLLAEPEQLLVAAVLARTLFLLRRLRRGANGIGELRAQLAVHLRAQPSLRRALDEAIGAGRIPYAREALPIVALVAEEAATLLAQDRQRPGSVFREIARQGRKFGLGLVIVSQQVRALDAQLLAQTGAELILGLGHEEERRAAADVASAEIAGGAAALRRLERGEGYLCLASRRVALPIAVAALGENRD